MSSPAARKKADMEGRTALDGMAKRLFDLVSKGATSAQWAAWLRVPLEHALAEGDKELALGLLKAGADGGTGWKGCDGRTLLDAAAEGGDEELVSTLLDAGGVADLNAVSGHGKMTALHRASKGGNAGAARILVVAGADANVPDSRNRNALHYAVESGNFQLTGDVLISGADRGAQDIDGDTPLHLAAVKDDANFIRTLLRREASAANVANSRGHCPLHLAVVRDRTSVAEALLKAGADPNARYGNGNRWSPLTLARSSLAMTRTLLKFGADVKSSDSMGYTVLHWATGCSEVSVIDALVEAGANIETKSSRVFFNKYYFKGMTPLHAAAFWRHQVGGMAVLLRKGANINSKDANGLTPLHVVCKTSAGADSVKAADLLLRWGADETATDNDGKTPGELIESDTDLDGRLAGLLTNAPADRVWRRRGMLVMCRARSTNFPGETGLREATSDGVLFRAVRLTTPLFQMIVQFL